MSMTFDYVILVDSFKPINNSAAVMIDELGIHMSKENTVCIITEESTLKNFYSYEKLSNNYYVLRLKTFKRYRSNFLRGFSELINPYLMVFIFRSFGLKNRILAKNLIWYSPSIFYSPFISYFKKINNARTYLILRDMFPLWMVDLGLLKKGSITHNFLLYFEKKQYKLADSIGVQVNTNINIVKSIINNECNIHVLNNWKSINPPINFKPLSHNLNSVYAGNIGIAQGINNFHKIINLSTIKNFNIDFFSQDINFDSLKTRYKDNANSNFLNSIPNNELEKEYLNYDFGFVLLDQNHKTNNIPGKFISYISNGLPVFCILNKGNPLINIIDDNNLGVAFVNNDEDCIEENWKKFTYLIHNENLRDNCVNYAKKYYDVSSISNQIRENIEKILK